MVRVCVGAAAPVEVAVWIAVRVAAGVSVAEGAMMVVLSLSLAGTTPGALAVTTLVVIPRKVEKTPSCRNSTTLEPPLREAMVQVTRSTLIWPSGLELR